MALSLLQGRGMVTAESIFPSSLSLAGDCLMKVTQALFCERPTQRCICADAPWRPECESE